MADTVKQKEHFEPLQRVVLNAYVGGELSYINSDKELENCGDSLLIHLVSEMLASNDCVSVHTAQARLAAMIDQLHGVQAALVQYEEDQEASGMRTGVIISCCHRVDWRLADYPGTELPEDAQEHIKNMISDEYRQGELLVSSEDRAQEYRGWWSIFKE